MYCNAQALNALVEHIKSFDEDVKVVLEATGGYHQVVVTKLLESEIFTVVVNPYIMKRYCAASLRKAKTDKIDCATRIMTWRINPLFKKEFTKIKYIRNGKENTIEITLTENKEG